MQHNGSRPSSWLRPSPVRVPLGCVICAAGGAGATPVGESARRGDREFVARGLMRRREDAEKRAGSGSVPGEREPSPPGSSIVGKAVSSGGIRGHPAAERAGRGRPQTANADPPASTSVIATKRVLLIVVPPFRVEQFKAVST